MLVYRDYWSKLIRLQLSDEKGVFEDAQLTTHTDESPALMIRSTVVSLDRFKIADEETKRQYLELDQQIRQLRDQQTRLLEENLGKMPTLTWEWMRQHQPAERGVEEPFKHKKVMTALRRGSKAMVDGSTDAVRWHIACRVGRLKKKGSKNALVEIEGRQWRIPYHVLLPYSYQTLLSEKRRAKHSEKLNRMSRQVSRALNKIL